ncbi:YdcF family protein, partial [Candidatus Bathyarchaeota archaeon]|nr:YdcF family protein [Candidatus Bathyarchaeota archaeon]
MSLIVLGTVGVFLFKSRPALGKFLACVALTLFYIVSIPFIADSALQTLENPTTSSLPINKVQAIVVLGGGTYFEAPEYDSHTVNQYGLVRIRYGAYLHRNTGKPLLVTGGDPLGIGSS